MKVYEFGQKHQKTFAMFHCYPVFPIVPEAKRGWEQMVELTKTGGK